MNREKAIEMMHYLTQSVGGSVSDVKLMKLMYFADRKAAIETGLTITDDTYCSMNRGPVLSGSLNIINNHQDEFLEVFHEPKRRVEDGYPVNQLKIRGKADFEPNHLSKLETEILDEISRSLGKMSTNELVKYSHDKENCPEWSFPGGSSKPLSLETILVKNGVPLSEAKEIAKENRYLRSRD